MGVASSAGIGEVAREGGEVKYESGYNIGRA